MSLITIDKEVKQRIRAPYILDNLTERFKTTSEHYTFSSPTLWTLKKNLYYLLKHSEKKELGGKYKYKPDYLSYDEYGTVALKDIIMYVNNIFSIEDFDLDFVVIPTKDAIVNILKDKFPKLTVEELPTVDF